MRIAVTHENGEVFQHFGHTETFKVYEVEDGEVISFVVMGTDGTGHEAMADMLAGKGIDVLICGGLGQGAADALAASGITVYSGATGSCDDAVMAYLSGSLTSSGVNCDHHHDHEDSEEGCGGSCGGDCGSGCGGGCGGCGGHMQPIMEGKNVGKNVSVHYVGTFNDGTMFDSSYTRNQPLNFVCGVGMMIKGFDQAVANMEAGESIDIHLMPEEAYGEADPDAVFTVALADLPGAEELEEGQQVYLSDQTGRPFPVKVVSKDAETITFDANHEMAGKELNFRIELLDVQEA